MRSRNFLHPHYTDVLAKSGTEMTRTVPKGSPSGGPTVERVPSLNEVISLPKQFLLRYEPRSPEARGKALWKGTWAHLQSWFQESSSVLPRLGH